MGKHGTLGRHIEQTRYMDGYRIVGKFGGDNVRRKRIDKHCGEKCLAN